MDGMERLQCHIMRHVWLADCNPVVRGQLRLHLPGRLAAVPDMFYGFGILLSITLNYVMTSVYE